MGLQNKKILASVLFVSISFVSAAQGLEPPPPMPPPPPGLPIDDYIYVILIIALIYGVVKKIKFSER